MRHATRPAWRRIDGIVLLDKPIGLSSNQALQKVRRIFRAEKAGHTGALDPLATGLLPICLGEATKIAGLLLAGTKAYRTRVQLGAETDSDDAEGRVIRQSPVPALERASVEALLSRFQGRIQQVPPRYSALKRDGEPLYRRARRGEDFEPAARAVEVIRIDLAALGPDWLELEVECGSGTYIRSLARDIGTALGCGGHVSTLRRLWVEPFRSPRMYELDELAALAAQGDAVCDGVLLPIAAALPQWRRVALTSDQTRRLRQGQRIALGVAPGPVLAMDPQDAIIGLAQVEADGVLVARRLFAVPAAATG